MALFPINLKIHDRLAVIIGGGSVAFRKCMHLLEAGARVRVISPSLVPSLERLRDEKRIECLMRGYRKGDLEGAFLAFAATDDPAVNREVAEEAAKLSLLADITDAPELGNFTTPAVLRRGDLLITVSTGGKSPAMARRIRNDLALRYGPEYAETLNILGMVREKLLTAPSNRTYNETVLRTLAEANLPDLIRQGDYKAVDRLLATLASPESMTAERGTGNKDLP